MKFGEYLTASTRASFFISPKGELVDTKGSHIETIIKFPEKFTLTKGYITSVHDKFNEKLTVEGKAREEIIKNLIEKGWIRIRRYPNKFWSIQAKTFSKKVKDYIGQWAQKILEGVHGFKETDKYMLVVLTFSSGDKKQYTVEELSKDILFNESIENILVIKNVEDLGFIVESSLSRLWKHNEKYDCGAISAFRKARNCGEGKIYTTSEKAKRNKSLKAKLLSKGYGVTVIKGVYPEGGKTAKEWGFFVADKDESGKLLDDLKILGEEFEQDSILFIPRWAISNKAKAYLYSTNSCPNNWLGKDNKEVFNKGKLGYDSPIYTSYVDNRPFLFEEIEEEILPPGDGKGWWILNIVAKKKWEDISE